MNRRNFIGSMLAAPAIVRAEILMPVTKIWTPSHDYGSVAAWRSTFLGAQAGSIDRNHKAVCDPINHPLFFGRSGRWMP